MTKVAKCFKDVNNIMKILQNSKTKIIDRFTNKPFTPPSLSGLGIAYISASTLITERLNPEK